MLFEYVRIHHKKEVLCNRIKKILRTRNKNVVAIRNFTDMAELADALDSGSSPVIRTIQHFKKPPKGGFYVMINL